MKYIVVRITESFEYETRNTMCIVDTEELAVRIMDWLKENDKPPFPDNERYVFYIAAPVATVANLEDFVKLYGEEM